MFVMIKLSKLSLPAAKWN